MGRKLSKLILDFLGNIAVNSTEYASIFGMGQPKEPTSLRNLRRGK